MERRDGTVDSAYHAILTHLCVTIDENGFKYSISVDNQITNIWKI